MLNLALIKPDNFPISARPTTSGLTAAITLPISFIPGCGSFSNHFFQDCFHFIFAEGPAANRSAICRLRISQLPPDPGDWPSHKLRWNRDVAVSIFSIASMTCVSSSSMRSSTSRCLMAACNSRIAPSRALSLARMAVFISSVMRAFSDTENYDLE